MNWYTGKVREPLLEGKAVTLAGQSFIVAPFNIRRMRQTAAARRRTRGRRAGAIRRLRTGSTRCVRARFTAAALGCRRKFLREVRSRDTLMLHDDSKKGGCAHDALVPVRSSRRGLPRFTAATSCRFKSAPACTWCQVLRRFVVNMFTMSVLFDTTL